VGRSRAKAALESIIFLAVVPGTVAGLIPWLLTGWRSSDPSPAARVFGALLIATGLGVLLHAFARFVMEGTGTPSPVAPTQSLVVGGLYRHVRNPMYLAVAAVIVGQALLLGRLELLVYAFVFMAVVATFVRLYEEPVLSRRFGDQYAQYRRAVPAWRPRLRGW
jgi:protein-S-isoprenylcysteine O-methyltransferase Ste14